MNQKAKVVVCGAGPGGVVTAWCLAKKGISVMLIDKSKFPRDKVCGDALSGKVVEVLKKIAPDWLNDLRINEKQLGSYGVIFGAPNGKKLRVPFKQAFSMSDPAPGFISKRLDFDYFLLQKALKHPLIDFFPEKEVVDAALKLDSVQLKFKSGEAINAAFVIGADGAHSKLAKLHGLKKENKYYCAAIRAYMSDVKTLDEENFIELLFLKKALPGYFWIFPLPNGVANVGLGMRSDQISKKKVNLNHLFNEIISTEPGICERFRDAKQDGEITGFGLPLGSKKRSISGKRYLLVGDAASLIDPFTGEGIGNAMVSGMFAADVVAENLEKEQQAIDLSNYDRLVYNRLWDELKLSYQLQQLVRFPSLFNFVVNKAHSNPTLKETISCMFEDVDLRDQFTKPSFYWKLISGR